MGSFVKIKPSRNGDIALLFTDMGISCLSRKFLSSQICLLTLFAKNKILAKISDITVLKSMGEFKKKRANWSDSSCSQHILVRPTVKFHKMIPNGTQDMAPTQISAHKPKELEVRSLYHCYSLTMSSRCFQF